MSNDPGFQKLLRVQQKLKAPKDLYNEFGKFPYRSAEAILEAVKPLLAEEGLLLTLSDNIVEVGGRVYVKATAHLSDNENWVYETEAFAREQETKRGMDASQITGSGSSYARKYALGGLFLIDSNKDADSMDNTQEGTAVNTPPTCGGDLERQAGFLKEMDNFQKILNTQDYHKVLKKYKVKSARDVTDEKLMEKIYIDMTKCEPIDIDNESIPL